MNARISYARRLFLMLIVSSLLIHNGSAAQSEKGTIEGRIVDEQTGEPLVSANIFINGTFIGATTDQNGYFVIEKVQPGTYILTCSAIGFSKQEVTIKVSPGTRCVVNFELKETAVPMHGIIVTASKFSQAIEDAPVAIDVIKPEDIAIRNSITVDQALQYVPGVQVAGNNISIRGAAMFSYGLGTRTLVLLDGVPFLSGDEGSADFSAVPASEIQQVEVMKGAGSALYGSSAMGGVINIITRKPEPDTSHISVSFYSGFYSQPAYDQWRWSDKRKMFKGTSLSYNTNVLGMASTISVNYHHNDSYKENADYYYWNLYGKFYLKLNPANEWLVQTGWLDSNVGGFIYWKDINHALESGSDPVDQFLRTYNKMLYVNSLMTQTLSSRCYYRLRFNFYRSHAEDIAMARPGFASETRGTFRETGAKTFGHEMQFGYQLNAQHNLTFGWDLNVNRIISIHYGNRQIANGSLYLQYTMQPLYNLKLDVGGRWDGERGKEVTEVSQFNPKVGINYQFREHNIWRISAGKGFRAPTIAERFISTISNQIRIKPNPHLKPERSLSLETGFRHQFNSFGYTDLGWFVNDFWELIDPQLQSGEMAVRFENITRARIYGFEMDQRLSFFNNQFSINVAYTYLHTQDLSKIVNHMPNPDYKKELKFRPNHLVTVRGQYQWRNWILGADFRYISKIRRVDRVSIVPDIEKQVPAYITDIQFGIHKPRFSLLGIIDNLFQYYYFISPGNLGDLRSFTLQLNWNLR